MLLKTKILVGFGFLIFIVLANVLYLVFSRVNSGSNYFVADQPYKLSSNQINGESYSIYAVISGFHEKSQYFYLLKEPVEFDDCGYFYSSAVFSNSPDFPVTEHGITEILVDSNLTFTFKYSVGVPTSHDEIIVVWKNDQ